MAPNDPLEIVGRLEAEIGLSSGFFRKLRTENDWSFVIKLHALFEAALGHVIVHRLGCDALGAPITRLEMSDKDKGKIAFASALGIIGADDRRYIILLSQLRNRCVHDVRQVEQFNLANTCEAMDGTQKDNFSKAVWPDERRRQELKSTILKSPKEFVWLAAMRVLAVLCLQKDKEQLKRDFDQRDRELTEQFFREAASSKPKS